MNNKARKSAAGKAGADGADGDIGEADNVDKIRDILFGSQMREVEQRFASLEKSLSRDLAALRKENTLQIESLKTFVESEIEILAGKLGVEEKARIENVDELEDTLKQQARQLDKKIADLGKSLDKNTRDINQKILKQSQDFSAELGSQIGEARERMDGQRAELAAAKVDKLALAEMFSALALQVNSEDK